MLIGRIQIVSVRRRSPTNFATYNKKTFSQQGKPQEIVEAVALQSKYPEGLLSNTLPSSLVALATSAISLNPKSL
jgi:hypothetical protein